MGVGHGGGPIGGGSSSGGGGSGSQRNRDLLSGLKSFARNAYKGLREYSSGNFNPAPDQLNKDQYNAMMGYTDNRNTLERVRDAFTSTLAHPGNAAYRATKTAMGGPISALGGLVYGGMRGLQGALGTPDATPAQIAAAKEPTAMHSLRTEGGSGGLTRTAAHTGDVMSYLLEKQNRLLRAPVAEVNPLHLDMADQRLYYQLKMDEVASRAVGPDGSPDKSLLTPEDKAELQKYFRGYLKTTDIGSIA